MSTPFVSVIIPARDEGASIRDTLAGLQAQTYPRERIEFLVVDGRSSDDTRSVVQEVGRDDPRVRLLDNPDRVTPGALNIGIRAARGSVISLMSAHGTPAADYLAVAVELLETTGAWGVGGRIERVSKTPAQRAIAAATSSPIGVGDAVHNYASQAAWVETAFPGLWHRNVFERVGLFDPELVRNQDDELSYRIRQAGGGIWYDPAIVVRYQPRGSLRALFSQYRQYGMWKVRVFQKHPGAARRRHLVPAAFVGTVAGGALLVPFVRPAGLLSFFALGAYGALVFAATARRSDRGAEPLRFAASIAVLHTSYGLGFWEGLLRFAPRWLVRRQGSIERLPPRPEAAS